MDPHGFKTQKYLLKADDGQDHFLTLMMVAPVQAFRFPLSAENELEYQTPDASDL